MASTVRPAGTGGHRLGPPQPLSRVLCPRGLPLLVTLGRPLGLGFLTSMMSSCIRSRCWEHRYLRGSDGNTKELEWKGLGTAGGERQHSSRVPLKARVILDPWMKAMLSGVHSDLRI